jgi:hypothetical protein
MPGQNVLLGIGHAPGPHHADTPTPPQSALRRSQRAGPQEGSAIGILLLSHTPSTTRKITSYVGEPAMTARG